MAADRLARRVDNLTAISEPISYIKWELRLLTNMWSSTACYTDSFIFFLKVAGSRPDEVNFLIYLILPAALGPGVYSASHRNEYQKHKNNNVSVE
jgi:hypothetical protein